MGTSKVRPQYASAPTLVKRFDVVTIDCTEDSLATDSAKDIRYFRFNGSQSIEPTSFDTLLLWLTGTTSCKILKGFNLLGGEAIHLA